MKKQQKNPKYKSKFEALFANHLNISEIPFDYEKVKLKYTTEHTYSLDFSLHNGILLIETKGYFKPSDRAKHLQIREQNPDVEIRFVFMANSKIHKNSPTRYSDWCEKHGFKYTVSPMGIIPKEWLDDLKQGIELKKNEKKVTRKKKG